MSNVHGWTALAGAVVALAGGATTAHAAPRPQQKPKPALAVGTSSDGTWRLEGRTLTIRLRDWVAPRSSADRVAIVARCGDGVVEDGTAAAAAGGGRLPTFGVRAGRAARVATTTRTVRLTLARDVAARATWCGVEVAPGSRAPRVVAAWMTRRRGSAPACRPAGGERTIFETSRIRVFAPPADRWIDDAEVLRACLRPAGRSVGIAMNWAGGGGGGGGSETNDGFAATGRWLAWVSAYHPNDAGREGSATVVLRDLATAAGSAPVSLPVGSSRGRYPQATISAVTAQGVVVWIASTPAPGDGLAWVASLHAGTPDGRSVELARAAAGGAITDVVVDGGTVSWRNGGVPGQAPLPTVTASSAVLPLASGRAADRAAFRLEGRLLTVTLPRALAGRRGTRVAVSAICGADLTGGELPTPEDFALEEVPFTTSTKGQVTVPAGARTIAVRLERDLARWADRCFVGWTGGARYTGSVARMRLARGSAPGCSAPPGARVMSESDGALVLSSWVAGETSGHARHPACAKPDGGWRTIASSSWSKYNDGRYVRFATAGSRVAWVVDDPASFSDVTSCEVWTLDLADAAAQPRNLSTTTGPLDSCPSPPSPPAP